MTKQTQCLQSFSRSIDLLQYIADGAAADDTDPQGTGTVVWAVRILSDYATGREKQSISLSTKAC